MKLGLSINDPRAFQGYTLLAPFDSSNTYLLDMQGKVVQTWASDCAPALFPMILENGNLLRPGPIASRSMSPRTYSSTARPSRDARSELPLKVVRHMNGESHRFLRLGFVSSSHHT